MVVSSKYMKIKCPKKDCKHEWNYKGVGKFYATCPHCYKKINLKTLKKQKES